MLLINLLTFCNTLMNVSPSRQKSCTKEMLYNLGYYWDRDQGRISFDLATFIW